MRLFNEIRSGHFSEICDQKGEDPSREDKTILNMSHF